jgi:hypothetical protein
MSNAVPMVKALLVNLQGVIDIVQLSNEHFEIINRIEAGYCTNQLIKVRNRGISEVLKCRHVFIILKDSRFRPPPSPTIYMVEDLGPAEEMSDHSVEVGDSLYHVVGEEVFDSNRHFDEKITFFSSGFVLFPERRKGRAGIQAYFLIPTVQFPELEEKQEEIGIRGIVSVSPSSAADDFLRNAYELEKSPEYATILVGFNEVGPSG